jgi:hypothetical protein
MKKKTIQPAAIAEHTDKKGMNMYFEPPDESCAIGYKVSGAGVVYDSLRYFDALLKFWELCKIRTDDLQVVRMYETRTEVNRFVIKAEYDDRKRIEIERQAGLRTVKDVFGFITSRGAKIKTREALQAFVKSSLKEGIDYTSSQLIWFTDKGLKKVFYNYLKIDFF